MSDSNTRTTSLAHLRRGNVIIFVVAILAVISISAASYVTITGLGRSSAAAYQDRKNPLVQRDVVIGQIEDLLAADLYGNKVVTVATPFESGNRSIRPRPFEDGEFSDVPYTPTDPNSAYFSFDTRVIDDLGKYIPEGVVQGDPFTLRESPSLQPDQENDIPSKNIFQAALQDDAWLASSEPVDDGLENILPQGIWDTWPQITNLRSAYRWDNRADGNRGLWVRDTGRFVDLGNFFLSDLARSQNRGDPSALMTNLSENDPILGEVFTPGAETTEDHLARHPSFGHNQPVYQYQMNHMAESLDPALGSALITFDPANGAPFTHADTRLWADTDGDLRPDARWQELEAFNNLFGWRWFVAARIIDSSAMVNANTSLGPGDPALPEEYATGITPADIDIYRLLDGAAFYQTTDPGVNSMIAHPDVKVVNSGLPRSLWAAKSAGNHLQKGLRLLDAIPNGFSPSVLGFLNDDLATAQTDPIDIFNDHFQARTGIQLTSNNQLIEPLNASSFTPYPSLLPVQREVFYRLAASNVSSPNSANTHFYGDQDEIDLRTFWGYTSASGVTPIETSFDNSYNTTDLQAQRTPKLNLKYGDPNSLGLLRSNEDMSVVRSFDAIESGLIGPSTPNYPQKEKIIRIMADTRRLVTTYSGEGLQSPVPSVELNGANATRLRVNDDVTELSPQDYVEKAFSGFMWALAPLAVDRPVIPGLVPNNQFNNYPYDKQLAHYGGNFVEAQSLATQWAIDLGAATSLTPPTDPGVSYALHRALSLAVNLKDAVDKGGLGPVPLPNDHTKETPTIARFFPDTNVPGKFATSNIPIKLEPDFEHGKITSGGGLNANSLPTTIFGQPDNGITVVGLEPQPFLVESMAAVLYSDADVDGAGDNTGVIETSEVVGYIFAVELGNPWPFEIDASNGYELSIPLTMTTRVDVQLSDYENLPIPLPGLAYPDYEPDSVIPAESSKIFVFVSGYQDAATTNWEIFTHHFLNDLQTAPLNTSNVPLTLLTGASMFVTPNQIPWIGAPDQPVLLYQDVGLTNPVLVDRLTPNPGGIFPGVLSADIDLSTVSPVAVGPITDAGPDSTGRALVVSRLTRPDQQVNGDGFPQYVFERADWNLVTKDEGADSDDSSVITNLIDMWHPNRGEPDLPIDDFMTIKVSDGVSWSFGILEQNPGTTIPIASSAPFQLFQPDDELLTRSELLRLTAYAHTYFHNDPTDSMTDLTRWWTISEQLAAPSAFKQVPDPASTMMSPYAGLLDPTRFVLGGGNGAPPNADLGLDNLPTQVIDQDRFDPTPTLTQLFNGPLNPFAVPLALRVVDAFEVLGTNGDIAHGKININTAPEAVLRVLPHVDPMAISNAGLYTPGAPNVPSYFGFTNRNEGTRRIRMIQSYRDPAITNNDVPNASATTNWRRDNPTTEANAAPYEITGAGVIPGLRGGQNSGTQNIASGRKHETHGFASLGELAILGQWVNGAGGVPLPSTGMLQAGEVTTGNEQEDVFNLRNKIGGPRAFDPANDPHERMLNFQAISNIATTRSDVYTAWFILRAYSPADIEAITIPSSITDPLERVAYGMDGAPDGSQPGLQPIYESRWLVVFDRSKVKLPTDRPNVVLIARLPLTSP